MKREPPSLQSALNPDSAPRPLESWWGAPVCASTLSASLLPGPYPSASSVPSPTPPGTGWEAERKEELWLPSAKSFHCPTPPPSHPCPTLPSFPEGPERLRGSVQPHPFLCHWAPPRPPCDLLSLL